MIFPDYHLHSTFSCDAKASIETMCQAAVALGFHEIGFSEHYDLNPVDDCYDWLKLDAWYAELERCRSKLDGQLTIRAGLEFSEPHLYPQGVQTLLDRLPFDYIIGSLHYVGAELVFSQDYFKRRSTDQAFLDYFTELERMTSSGNFDILGHLDVLALTGKLVDAEYVPSRYEAEIRAVLRHCIERGISIEINTQGLRKPAQMLVPGMQVLQWYAEMGGDCFSPGSDAHLAEHMGLNLDVAVQTALQAGLKSIPCFEARRKRVVPISGVD